ncbi:MAG: ribosome maturation factor RimP [Nitrospinae bacterium]|nr:ribosome maturation factor RimP [Nitrospinota bacterium]MCH7651278.1 ribosome maturation factor RimP [Nitrospinota bacterium]
MGKGSVVESIETLVTPILQENRLELVDVEYKKEGKNWFLRIFIDKEGGITVGDCTQVSRRIEDLIEVEEVVPSSYTLEVSSPGLDRPLKKEKDFLRFQGKRACVTTFTPICQQKNFKGTIRDFREDVLFLETERQLVEIPKHQIAKAKLEIEI